MTATGPARPARDGGKVPTPATSRLQAARHSPTRPDADALAGAAEPERAGRHKGDELTVDAKEPQAPVKGDRRLDFLVTGATLSGGATLEELLNTRADIYCGAEVVGGRHALGALKYPDSFLTRRVTANAAQAALLRTRTAPRLLGLQDVKVLRNLDRLVDAVGGRRILFCARAPGSTAEAWQDRLDSGNPNWAAGRIGAFGAAESVIATAAVLAFARETAILVPHTLLVREPEQALSGVLAFLGMPDAPADPAAQAALRAARTAKRDARRRAAKAAAAAPEAAEPAAAPAPDGAARLLDRVLGKVRADSLGSLLEARDAMPLSRLAPQLTAEIAAVHPSLVTWLVRAASELGLPDVSAQAVDWGKRMQPIWRRARAVLVPQEA